ncbi:type VI secretion system tube protein Hcp [Serratia marcescens]|uniref:type VI secretion system tube protein Hcp n=1 Tax=Serratia marcescens TaxID=615 RepID=UPI00374E5670
MSGIRNGLTSGHFTGAHRRGGDAGTGERGEGVVFNDLIVQVVMDRAVPALLRCCASGRRVNRVELSLCGPYPGVVERSRVVLGGGSRIDLVKEAGSDAVCVTYCFRATAVRHHYWSPTPQGRRGTESMAGWDRRQHKAL